MRLFIDCPVTKKILLLPIVSQMDHDEVENNAKK